MVRLTSLKFRLNLPVEKIPQSSEMWALSRWWCNFPLSNSIQVQVMKVAASLWHHQVAVWKHTRPSRSWSVRGLVEPATSSPTCTVSGWPRWPTRRCWPTTKSRGGALQSAKSAWGCERQGCHLHLCETEKRCFISTSFSRKSRGRITSSNFTRQEGASEDVLRLHRSGRTSVFVSVRRDRRLTVSQLLGW